MASVRKALLLSLIERYFLLVLALVSNLILARLLTPEQIGIYSVSMAVLGIAQVLRDFGIGSYLIQIRELDVERMGTAFGMSLVLGAGLFSATFFAAGYVASFYGDPRVATTLRICALNFVCLPFSTVPMAVLRRELNFKATMHASILGGFVGAVVSVALAAGGYGVNALAIGAVAGNAALVATLVVIAPRNCFPRPQFSHWRAMLNFGGQSSMVGVVNSVAMDMNDLVVGKVLNFQAVAMLSRSQGLMNMFNRDLMGAIRNVSLPAFAEAHRNGVNLEHAYARAVTIMTVFGWPIHTLIGVYGLEVMHLLYGQQWHDAAPLVPIFSLAGSVSLVNALTPGLLTAVGRIDIVTKVELLLQLARIALIAGAVIVFRSIEACAIAYLVISILALPVFGWARHQVLDGRGKEMRLGLSKSLFVTVACLSPSLAHVSYLGWFRAEPIAVWQWMSSCFLGGLFALGASWLVRHPILDEPWFVRMRSKLSDWLSRRANASPSNRGK